MEWNKERTGFQYKGKKFRVERGKFACGWNLNKNIGRNDNKGYTKIEALDFIINNHHLGWKAVNYRASIGSEWDEPFMGVVPTRIFSVRRGEKQQSISKKIINKIEEIYGNIDYQSYCYCFVLDE